MSNSTFSLVVTGELAEHTSVEAACTSIAAMFKVSNERAQELLNSAPKIVKTGLDQATAGKYQQVIEKAGIKVELRAESAAAPAAVAPVSAAPNNVEANVTTKAASPQQAPTQSEQPVSANVSASAPANRSFDGLTFKIEGQPDFSFLTVQLPAKQMLKVEASAMATMDTNLVMKTKMKGGLSRLLTGESIFLNEYTAEAGPGEIGIAPATPGDLVHRHLKGETLYLQNSAFVASTPGINIETKWQGLAKGFFSGENLFLIRASGEGDLWFNSYGSIIEIDVADGYVVDTGNIVAFTDGLEYSISKVGGYKSFFLSGEGFVCRFTGKGKIWIQTRSVGSFVGWAQIFRPVKKAAN